MQERRVGFFGGTFDPIHFGHLNLAIEILEKCSLDQILFCPALLSPEKGDRHPTATPLARKEMVTLAIEPIPEFSLIDLELDREGPSYTIDTIKALIEMHPATSFHLLLGEDMLAGLPEWKAVEELVKLAPPLVGSRSHHNQKSLPEPLASIIQQGEVLISPMEISSTEVRRRLEQKKYCGHLIPAKVLDYIEASGLY